MMPGSYCYSFQQSSNSATGTLAIYSSGRLLSGKSHYTITIENRGIIGLVNIGLIAGACLKPYVPI